MRIWNKRVPFYIKLRLWWQRLWIRRDEFHSSLDTDPQLLQHMCSCEQNKYCEDLVHRRETAHQRDRIER